MSHSNHWKRNRKFIIREMLRSLRVGDIWNTLKSKFLIYFWKKIWPKSTLHCCVFCKMWLLCRGKLISSRTVTFFNDESKIIGPIAIIFQSHSVTSCMWCLTRTPETKIASCGHSTQTRSMMNEWLSIPNYFRRKKFKKFNTNYHRKQLMHSVKE